MQTIFDKSTRDMIVSRISMLKQSNQAVWGKMNASQMVEHCIRFDKMLHGDYSIRRAFIGRIFGKMAMRSMLSEDKPLPRNVGTLTQLLVSTETDGIEPATTEWIEMINRYSNFQNKGFVHAFFGPMTDDEIGRMAYKHADHHLRQFGV